METLSTPYSVNQPVSLYCMGDCACMASYYVDNSVLPPEIVDSADTSSSASGGRTTSAQAYIK